MTVPSADTRTTPTASSIPSPTQAAPHPYTIARTRQNNLPIYEDVKNGGNKHLTQIRKVTGNLDVLQGEIRDLLALPQYTLDVKGRRKEMVAINRVTRQIVIRGWRAAEVKKWAEAKGF